MKVFIFHLSLLFKKKKILKLLLKPMPQWTKNVMYKKCRVDFLYGLDFYSVQTSERTNILSTLYIRNTTIKVKKILIWKFESYWSKDDLV